MAARGGEPRGMRGRAPASLILAPTRELALQVSEAIQSFGKHLNLRVATLYGGASYAPQLRALRDGAHVVVGTPGRLIDHLDRRALGSLNDSSGSSASRAARRLAIRLTSRVRPVL